MVTRLPNRYYECGIYLDFYSYWRRREWFSYGQISLHENTFNYFFFINTLTTMQSYQFNYIQNIMRTIIVKIKNYRITRVLLFLRKLDLLAVTRTNVRKDKDLLNKSYFHFYIFFFFYEKTDKKVKKKIILCIKLLLTFLLEFK